jgi:hypothetical protein
LSKTSGKERRAHERHDTELTVHGSPDEGGVVARMVARNLSLGGLYCTSTTDFPEMSRLAVRLMLPMNNGNPKEELQPVDLEAVVVRREEIPGRTGKPRFDLALFFTNIEDGTRGQIQCYLDKHVK